MILSRYRGHSQEQAGGEGEGEHDLVALEERATDVAVEAVGEVVGQVAQATLHDFGFVTVKCCKLGTVKAIQTPNTRESGIFGTLKYKAATHEHTQNINLNLTNFRVEIHSTKT